MQFRERKAFRAMLKYKNKNNHTLSQGGGLDIGLKVGILADIGYMLHKCAVHNAGKNGAMWPVDRRKKLFFSYFPFYLSFFSYYISNQA